MFGRDVVAKGLNALGVRREALLLAAVAGAGERGDAWRVAGSAAVSGVRAAQRHGRSAVAVARLVAVIACVGVGVGVDGIGVGVGVGVGVEVGSSEGVAAAVPFDNLTKNN